MWQEDEHHPIKKKLTDYWSRMSKKFRLCCPAATMGVSVVSRCVIIICRAAIYLDFPAMLLTQPTDFFSWLEKKTITIFFHIMVSELHISHFVIFGDKVDTVIFNSAWIAW